MKKMLSILLTIAMMLSMAVSVYAEASGVVVNGDVYINDADFSVKSSDGAYKPASKAFQGASGDTVIGPIQPALPMIADVNLNVEKAGFYKVVVDSTHKVASSSMGTVGLEINNKGKVNFSATNSTYTTPAIDGANYPNSTFAIHSIAYNEYVCLGKGENNLKVHWANDVGGSANMAFDGVKLEYAGELPTIDGTESTTLEFEDYTYGRNVITSAGASGGDTNNHVRFYGSSGVQYITMKFDVAKTDYYTMTVDASTTNNGSPQQHLSDWHVTVNDEPEISVGNAYQTNYTTVSGATYTKTFLQSRSKLNKKFLLTEGENTITFRVIERLASHGGGVYAEFDCLNLTATNSLQKISGTEATTMGNSSFEWSHSAKKTSDLAYDGTYTKFEGGGATITAKKTVYVEETKEYALNVYAAASVTNEWMSDLKVAIDDDAAVTFTSSNADVEALASPLESGSFSTKNIKYKTNILLEEGLHTITFTVPQASSYGQKQQAALFTFDCATLTPTDTLLRVNDTTATTIGNSSFKWNATAGGKSDNAYDGTYTKFEGAEIPITATKTFYVEEDAEYFLNIYGASSVTNEYLSDIQFAIDEDATVTLKKGVNAKALELASPCISTGDFAVKDIVYYEKISLKQGVHTITFTIPNKTITSSNRGFFAFDRMILTPVVDEVLSAEGGAIEIDKCVSPKYIQNSTDASGGKYAIYNAAAATTETVTFIVEEEGYYNMVLEATSAKLSENVMSYMVLGLNNSTTYDLTYEDDNHTAVYKTNASGNKYPDDVFAIAEISLNDAVYLNAGLNTITINIPNRVGFNDNAYAVLDCFRFTPVGEDILGIKAEVGDYTINLGDELSVNVTDTDGNDVTDITFASSDETVISVGVDKKLTAVGCGRATITVSARKNATTPEHTTSFVLYVGDNGVFVKSINKNNGVISANLELDGADASKLDVYAAIYSGGKLLAVNKGEIVDGSVSIEIGEESGRTVIYAWEKGTLKPYYTETLK